VEQISQKLQQVCQELFGVKVEPLLTRPDEQFGDYATNIAMQLAGQLQQDPRDIATKIVEKLQGSEGISKVEIAGPGFINLTISDTQLFAAISQKATPVYANTKMVIETNNPNPFKDIHIGHAFNSIVADTMANLLEAGGAEVHRVSYHGDVGVHVGKSLWAILNEFGDEAPAKLAEIPEAERPVRLREWYARGAGMYEEEPTVKTEVERLTQESFSLQDPLIKQVYEICKSWSFDYFSQVFTRIGSKAVERQYLESEADAAGRQTVEQHIGDVFEESAGAIIFPGEKYDLHTRVFISGRGTTLYEARDLGLIQLKHGDYQPDKSYIVTAEEQKEYFRVVLKAAELAMPELTGHTVNISTGTVKLSSGKMSSRTGQVVTIEWLLDTLDEAVQARGAAGESIQPSVIAAIRYAMLKGRYSSDIIFDIEQSVSLEGNTGPYLQYAHARARSILAKSSALSPQPSAQLQPAERSLLRKLTEYPENLNRAVSELMPHYVCTYLFELAQKFNQFYEHNRVLGDEREAVRLQLVRAYADTLKNGLELLNIPAPDHM
jgi:arginyl-tRNA synthetase